MLNNRVFTPVTYGFVLSYPYALELHVAHPTNSIFSVNLSHSASPLLRFFFLHKTYFINVCVCVCVCNGCQNPDLDLTILRFYNLTCPKRSGFFKNLFDHSRSVKLYDSDDLKRLWFLIIFFKLKRRLSWTQMKNKITIG